MMDVRPSREFHSIYRYICILAVVFLSLDTSHCFKVYWNVPSKECQKHGIYINASAYGIVQNSRDDFYGDKVSIFYNAGKFPMIKNNHFVNGGIPQNGSMDDHARTFMEKVQKQLPDKFKGVAVLDFETYYPSYSMSPVQYKTASKSWVTARHPDWSPDRVENEAQRTFNESARDFFQVLLELGQALRPQAKWGYYHYPYCHNYYPYDTRCKTQVMSYNDEMSWLMKASSALYPSIYIFDKSGWSPRSRRRNAEVRMKETLRVRKNIGKQIPILPYFWYRYKDVKDYISPIDLINTIGLAKVMKLEGIVIWGSTAEFRSVEQCSSFKDYLEKELGPLAQYVQRSSRSVLRRTIKSRRRLKKFYKAALMEAN